MGEKKHCTGDTPFIRFLGWFFGSCGNLVVNHAWKLMIASTLLTLICTIKIPLTKLTNKIDDFTPLDAPSYAEWQAQKNFFDGITSNVIFAFVTAKDGEGMFTTPKMEEAIRVLDTINAEFKMKTIGGDLPFEQFCRAFCLINEPVRTFYNGMRLRETLGDNATNVDISYPDTSVMGVRSHMDPYLYGVKLREKRGNDTVIVPSSQIDFNTKKASLNNIVDYKMTVLVFKSELDPMITSDQITEWELSVVDYFKSGKFNSSLVHVTVYSESFLTAEIVRSGLSLLPFLLIGFIIMVTFSAFSFTVSGLALNQMNIGKMWFAWYACVTPFMASGTGLGLMLLGGFRFGSILCVTPFLILAIGVDDAYLMVNAWQQITATRRGEDLRSATIHSELLLRTKEMLIETGPSIAITTITNVAAFLISAISGSPEIQLFSIGNAVCVLVAFVYQLTVYGSLMVILGRKEIKNEFRARILPVKTDSEKANTSPLDLTSKVDAVKFENRRKGKLTSMAKSLLRSYCEFLSNRFVNLVILTLLGVYLLFAITGTLTIKAEIRPDKLFLQDSPFVKIFYDRQNYIVPHYSVAWIYVLNPGDIWDPVRRAVIDQMVNDFETLPESVGKYSSKLWIRDFEEFAKANPDLLTSDLLDYEEPDPSKPPSHYAQLQGFLSWPENSYWRGFMQFQPEETVKNGSEPAITRFAFTTAYKGEEQREWSTRAVLMRSMRTIAAKYSMLNVTVFQDDAKFLDIIETMIPQSRQSALLTFVSMFIVTFLFIPAPLVLSVATFSIMSTSLGVFGFMSWIGTELDPILMSATIMSIGFSVDIPAHIAYHYHQTGSHFTSVVDRLEHTISRVGFPIAQASISTILCVSSLFFVNLHMSTIFAATMLSVVVIGTIHGLFVMPALFSTAGMIADMCRSGCCSRVRSSSLNSSPSSSSPASSTLRAHGRPGASDASIMSAAGSTTIMVQ